MSELGAGAGERPAFPGGDGLNGNGPSGSGDASVSELGAGAGERSLDGCFGFRIEGALDAGG